LKADAASIAGLTGLGLAAVGGVYLLLSGRHREAPPVEASLPGERLDRSRIPGGLVRALQEGKCFGFVGAGASKNAGSPVFVELLQHLCKHTPEDDRVLEGAYRSANELRALAEGDEMWEMTNYELDKVQFDLFRIFKYSHMQELSQQKFPWKSPWEIKSDAYNRQRKAFLDLPFVGFATWNWDNLLDLALVVEPLPRHFSEDLWTRVSEGWAARDRGRRSLFKLNGSITAKEGDPCAAVFGEDDYKAVEEDRRRFHQEVGKRFSICTLGLRMESEETPYNPVGMRWWSPVGSAAGSDREHYVILPQAKPGSAEEKRIFEMEATYRVKVITFPLFDEEGKYLDPPVGLAELLERIREEVNRPDA